MMNELPTVSEVLSDAANKQKIDKVIRINLSNFILFYFFVFKIHCMLIPLSNASLSNYLSSFSQVKMWPDLKKHSPIHILRMKKLKMRSHTVGSAKGNTKRVSSGYVVTAVTSGSMASV